VVAKPGTLPRGAVVDELVRNVDVTPTILDLLGVKPDAGLDGRSLVPLAKGEKDVGVPPGSYAETLHPRVRGKSDELRSYRTEDWKYVRHLHDGVVQREELFSLSEDPGELDDRSGAPELADERTKLGALLDRATREERSTPFETGAGKPTGEIEQKLEALGYLD
jgi:arylsulfatase A-like enzyme